MAQRNPKRFDRCVTKVKRSLVKTGRSGNAYAICKASTRNPAKWNPILPLDIFTASQIPVVLGSIEKQRQKIERGMKPKKRNNLLGFLTKKRVTYHAHIVRKTTPVRLASYQGKAIYKTPEGDYTTSLDRDSRHDSLADAKAFIRSFKTNRKNRGKRNPETGAREFYEGFHGEPSKHSVVVRTPIHYHKHTGEIGKLIAVVIKPELGGRKVTLSKFGKNRDGIPAILSSNEHRNQMFIDGGDQGVNLAMFGIKKPHEQEVLGKAIKVIYFTTKKHLRPEDGGTANYDHRFGKRETSFRFGRKKPNLPTVLYDVRNKLLSFAGGDYDIPDEGIDG